MKNRKTSYSLSKLNLKNNDPHQSSQRSFKRKHSRKANRSQIQRININSPLENQHHQAVLNQYYGTTKNRIGTSSDNFQLLQNSKRFGIQKITTQIQQKMRRVIENHEFDSDINFNNVVLQQSDADQQFEDKIMQNKYLLKQQREKQNNFSHSHQKLHNEIEHLMSKKQSKKYSLIKNINQKPVRKHKTKSLLPGINSSSSKILSLVENKLDKNRLKNQSQRQILKQDNKHFLPNIKQSKPQHFQNQNYNQNSIDQKMVKIPINDKKKDDKFKRKFTQSKKQQRKLAQLKLQSKIQELKIKIAQRTSIKDSKSRILDKNIVQPHKKKHSRYSSHSVFDNIQQFLSNPHQNNTKSQRKFMKLYQKMEQNQNTYEQQKQSLKRKIQQIEAKIQQRNNNQKINNQQLKDNEILQRPTSTGSSPITQQDSQFGVLDWRRMQKQRINKSSFENELKYVKSLEQKGHANLLAYIQNQKILHELKMIKKTQQMLVKVQQKNQNNFKLQKYTSL